MINLDFLFSMDFLDLVVKVLGVIGGLGVLFSGLRDILARRKQKLYVHIEEKKWTRDNLKIEPNVDIEVKLYVKLLFINKLGKDTTITEIRIERENGEPITVSQQRTIPNGLADRMEHHFDLGSNVTTLKGKLVVDHTYGKTKIQLDETFDFPFEDMEYDGPIVRLLRDLVKDRA